MEHSKARTLKAHQAIVDTACMIKKMPRRVPALADMLEDLSATPADVAKALRVNQSTVYRWIKQNKAPWPVMLSLYWVTRWGLSELDAELFNRANTYQGYADSLKRALSSVEAQMQHLSQIGHYGSANDPLPSIVSTQTFPPRPSIEPAGTHQSRQNPQAEPVMPGADAPARHLATGPA
jgi:predicted DNA-binding transcriptional regulator AlpA